MKDEKKHKPGVGAEYTKALGGPGAHKHLKVGQGYVGGWTEGEQPGGKWHLRAERKESSCYLRAPATQSSFYSRSHGKPSRFKLFNTFLITEK